MKLDYENYDYDCSELLLEAIKRDDRGIVEHLLEGGADLENSHENEDTPLHVAAKYGSANVAKCLLGRKTDPSALDGNWETPLRIAALNGRSGIVSMLLDSGSDVHRTSGPSRFTPLHLAVGSRDVNTIIMLLEHGASISAINLEEETPIHLAARYSTADILGILLNYVKQASDLDLLNGVGDTALHIAVKNSDSKEVGLLLGKGADLLATNRDDMTPIHCAAKYSAPEPLEILLGYVKQPCDLDLRERYGDTALHLAVVSELSKNVAMLLEKGADVLASDAFDRTPIHYAAKYSTPELLEMLLRYVKQPCELDLRDEYGDTALHRAIRAKSTVKVEMLLRKGADFTVLNKSFRESALNMALSSDEEGFRELGRRCERSYEMGSSRLLPDIEISSMV